MRVARTSRSRARARASAARTSSGLRPKSLPACSTVSVADVLWTCRRLARLSDQQWDDAFRAAGFADQLRQRYITKLKSKIAEGLALAGS